MGRQTIFHGMFMCLKLKLDGFMAGSRPIIGLDGYHLIGAYPGVCLTAISVDGNNNIYPLTWAIIDVEDHHTWTSCMSLLCEALGTEKGKGVHIHV